jgi:hypothetical protein
MPPLHVGFTEYFFIAAIALIFIVDGVLYLIGGDAKTISDRIAVWSMRYPIVAALGGILAGHLFWPNLGYCP